MNGIVVCVFLVIGKLKEVTTLLLKERKNFNKQH